MSKTFRKITGVLICLLGIYLLYPKIITFIPHIDKPLATILMGGSIVLILSALIFKSQRGLISPGIFSLLISLFLFYRDQSFFPSFLNGIIILPLMVAVSFLALLPFEPEKRKVIIPSIVFIVMAGVIYFSEGKLIRIFKNISIDPIQVIAILLILWGVIRFFKH